VLDVKYATKRKPNTHVLVVAASWNSTLAGLYALIINVSLMSEDEHSFLFLLILRNTV
jgi:hypothetical protein